MYILIEHQVQYMHEMKQDLNINYDYYFKLIHILNDSVQYFQSKKPKPNQHQYSHWNFYINNHKELQLNLLKQPQLILIRLLDMTYIL